MSKAEALSARLQEKFAADDLISCELAHNEVTITVPADKLLSVARRLHDDRDLAFTLLIDLCGVDYSAWGDVEWATEEATGSGFSRGVRSAAEHAGQDPDRRFAVVYHLLSVTTNERLRMRVFAQGEPPKVDSVVEIWNGVNWFEREAFDMFGILFEGHPDLRRLLTDYGFIGYPFRKDFPLIGHVEMRYDETRQRVVYEPVSLEPRVLVPRVTRDDHRYIENNQGE